MKICGSCGRELRCIKTGLTIHDDRYRQDSRHQADLFLCEQCGTLFINRAEGEWFDAEAIPDCVIHNGEQITYTDEFRAKILSYYNFELPNN
jgi:hypothetical protein